MNALTIEHGAEIADPVVNAVVRNAERIEQRLRKQGYISTAIRVRPDWAHDFSLCEAHDFENWIVGYVPATPIDTFRKHSGQITGCMAGVLDEIGALPQMPVVV